jgi:hypothetical protein
MYPHVVQFETRKHQDELESQLILERKQARADNTVDRPSLTTRIGSALTGRGVRRPTATSER